MRPKRSYLQDTVPTGTITWRGGNVLSSVFGKFRPYVKLTYSINGANVECSLLTCIHVTRAFEIADPNSNRELDEFARHAHKIAQWMLPERQE